MSGSEAPCHRLLHYLEALPDSDWLWQPLQSTGTIGIGGGGNSHRASEANDRSWVGSPGCLGGLAGGRVALGRRLVDYSVSLVPFIDPREGFGRHRGAREGSFVGSSGAVVRRIGRIRREDRDFLT